MPEAKVITKQLAGAEDIVRGIGLVSQNRGTGPKSITKLNVSELLGAVVVDSLIEMNQLDIALMGDTKACIVNGVGIYYHNGTQWLATGIDSVDIENRLVAIEQTLIDEELTFVTVSADYLAKANDIIILDTSSSVGIPVITLPLAPNEESIISFVDSTTSLALKPILIGRNGETIMGLAEDMTVDTDNISFDLLYINGDWRIR